MGFNVHICTEKKGVEVGINVSFVHKKAVTRELMCLLCTERCRGGWDFSAP